MNVQDPMELTNELEQLKARVELLETIIKSQKHGYELQITMLAEKHEILNRKIIL